MNNRFVIQEHTLNDSKHWDLMLESDGSLVTWQIPLPPEQWTAAPIECRKIFNHRLEYLTYNGPVSNNRGAVKIVKLGTYTAIKTENVHWQVHLTGNIEAELILHHKIDDSWFLEVHRS